MLSAPSQLARIARQSAIPAISAGSRASSSQAGPSKPTAPPTPKQSKRLPKSVVRDLVKLHHSASTFMHDPSQLPDAVETAFRSPPPAHLSYTSFLQAAGASTTSTKGKWRYNRLDSETLAADEPVATFGKVKSTWSDLGALGGMKILTEREKQVREALFGTYERGPGESVRPGLEGIEEWLDTSGTSVEQVAKDWEERHNEVTLGNGKQAPRDTEDGQ